MGLLLKPAIMVSRKHRGRSDGSCLALLQRMDDHELMLFYVHGYAEGGYPAYESVSRSRNDLSVFSIFHDCGFLIVHAEKRYS